MAETTRVVAFPGWKENPFLNLVYLATEARGVDVRYPRLMDEMLRDVADAGPETVLHVHWTSPVAQRTDDVEEAGRRVDRFVAGIDAARRRGVRLVWTVHNTLPHELLHRELELRLCQWLASNADAVHVMLPSTRDLVADEYVIPAGREVLVPHPSYQGLYAARERDRAAWRLALEVPEDRRSVLFFGQMRPYKGLDTLLSAYRLLAERGQELPVLLLAGSTPEGVEQHVSDALPPGATTVRAHRFVPDSEVEQWFGAADLAVYPYRSILNSGSVHLAATMAVPAVLPGEPHLVEFLGEESWVRFYDPARAAESLADVLAEPASYERDVAAMRDFSDRRSPWNVSQRFWELFSSV